MRTLCLKFFSQCSRELDSKPVWAASVININTKAWETISPGAGGDLVAMKGPKGFSFFS